MKRRPRTVAATLAPVRRLAMLVVLLAFAFQAYAVQTHLHGQPRQAPVAAHLLLQGDAPAKPLPADPLDPATCKLCQELIHSGAVITPAGPEMALLLDWATATLPSAWLPATTLLTQTGWQSRAPPRR